MNTLTIILSLSALYLAWRSYRLSHERIATAIDAEDANPANVTYRLERVNGAWQCNAYDADGLCYSGDYYTSPAAALRTAKAMMTDAPYLAEIDGNDGDTAVLQAVGTEPEITLYVPDAIAPEDAIDERPAGRRW